jgi:phage terminase small subunit
MEQKIDSHDLISVMGRYADAVRDVKAAQARHRGALAVASNIRETMVAPAFAAMHKARSDLDALVDAELGCKRTAQVQS